MRWCIAGQRRPAAATMRAFLWMFYRVEMEDSGGMAAPDRQTTYYG